MIEAVVKMEKNQLNHYKNLLLKEKQEIMGTLEEREENEFSTNLQDEIEELSVYDNHPGDIGTETYQMELNFALETHKKEELKNVEEALHKIEENKYGICEFCGKDIVSERLEYMPAAKLCSDCAQKRLTAYKWDEDRPVEEDVLYPPFERTNTDFEDSIVYDGEDAWQDIQQHGISTDFDDIGEASENIGLVEEVEKISNEQYKDQLPD